MTGLHHIHKPACCAFAKLAPPCADDAEALARASKALANAVGGAARPLTGGESLWRRHAGRFNFEELE